MSFEYLKAWSSANWMPLNDFSKSISVLAQSWCISVECIDE